MGGGISRKSLASSTITRNLSRPSPTNILCPRPFASQAQAHMTCPDSPSPSPSPSPTPKHAPFAAVQAHKPPWNAAPHSKLTQAPNPKWTYGSGTTSPLKSHIEIDPFAPGRPVSSNYTLLISGVAPRPIGFISTLSATGKPNLAPFSYFQVMDHDPPVFVVGFSGRAAGGMKDTLSNLVETGECTINMVSEEMIEAVNATSVDAPFGVSEWELAGLTMGVSKTVGPARVRESVFSVEGRLVEVVEFKTSNKAVRAKGSMAIIEGTRFWVREDAVDEGGKNVDLDVLKPVAQLGGMMYGRIGDTFELPRARWDSEMKQAGDEIDSLIGRKRLY